jgi:putative cardiolipin synthase
MKQTLALALSLCLVGRAFADRIRIIEDPREASQIRVDLIQQAKRSINAQYYIVGDDYFTFAGLALLRDAARRGCRVRLIIDGRSNKIPPPVHAHLKQEKVEIKIYHPITLRKLSWAVRRMHDKGMDVDGKYMIRGGRNVEGDYFGYAERNFVDRDVYAEGKVVAESNAYFDQLWNSAEVVPVKLSDQAAARAQEGRAILDAAREKLRGSHRVRLDARNDWTARSREVGRVIFFHDPVGRKGMEIGISTRLREVLSRAQRSVVVETPYLVPTKELLDGIQQAKQRGLTKIEMITNSIASNDSMLVQLGYETAKKKLLQLGVDLWEYKGPDTLHAKSGVLDDRIAVIGSFNIDPRSQHLNTETAVAIDDAATARELLRYINAHKPNCTHITLQNLESPNEAAKLPAGKRFKVSVMKALLPLLRGQL